MSKLTDKNNAYQICTFTIYRQVLTTNTSTKLALYTYPIFSHTYIHSNTAKVQNKIWGENALENKNIYFFVDFADTR